MRGHVRRRGERSWELKFDVGTDANGKRKIRYASFKGTKREAEVELARMIAAAAAGTGVDPSRMTVSEFLEQWERDWCASNVSPKTEERYRELLRIHVKPRIGGKRIQKVRPIDLTGLYGDLAREAELAPRTIGHIHRLIHLALSHAADWDIVATNVADRVSPPRVEDDEVEILSADQLRAILDRARGRPIYLVASLALATGMRRGELLALRWQDINLEKATVKVARSLEQIKTGLRFKEPKTKHGRRTITLPASAVSELRSHWKATQELRLALGAGKSPPASLVFCDLNGDPRRPDVISRAWRRTVTAAKQKATFHSLRHTHASHLIAAGVDILTVSRRLGHASPTVTLGVYGHLIPQADDRAALAIEAAITATRTE